MDPKPHRIATVIQFRELTDPAIIEQIHKLPEPFLECRTFGHSWTMGFLGATRLVDPELRKRVRESVYDPDGLRISHCERCATKRIEFYLYRFGKTLPMLLTRWYEYPDSYRIPGSLTYRVNMTDELFARHWQKGK